MLEAYVWGAKRSEAGDLWGTKLNSVVNELHDDCVVVEARRGPYLGDSEATQERSPVLVYCAPKTAASKTANSIVFLATLSNAQNTQQEGFAPGEIDLDLCALRRCDERSETLELLAMSKGCSWSQIS